MRELEEAVQRMLEFAEAHIGENPTLMDMSRHAGYSPSYCSQQFHRITGKTLRRYLAGRRLAIATLALRDTDTRIIEIALDSGYSSQEALARAFVGAYGLTPHAYRKAPRPVRLPIKQNVLFPLDQKNKEGIDMESTILTSASVRVEYIPAHKYMGIWEPNVDNYMDFWDRHDCDEVCGFIESMRHVADPIVTPHTAGWYQNQDGKQGYFYGLGVPVHYGGSIPKGFEIRDVKASYYLVFCHPPFDFQRDCAEVMRRVEELAWGYNPAEQGFRWNDKEFPAYQRHMPETLGYEILRPVIPNQP